MRNSILVAELFLIAIMAMKGSVVAATLEGHFLCGITDYMWTISPDHAPTATGKATMEFESDGNGRFTAGSLSEHLADDTRTFGERHACSS
jgi:hypothetical protein